jgi:hypothetical protein
MQVAGHRKNPVDSDRQWVPSGNLTSAVEVELKPPTEQKTNTANSRRERCGFFVSSIGREDDKSAALRNLFARSAL